MTLSIEGRDLKLVIPRLCQVTLHAEGGVTCERFQAGFGWVIDDNLDTEPLLAELGKRLARQLANERAAAGCWPDPIVSAEADIR